MTNTNTHILCEPYEVENYLNKDEITIENFAEKTNDLIQSLFNIKYDNIDEYRSMDPDIKSEALSIRIPKSFIDSDLDIIYRFSNKETIDNLLFILRNNTNDVFDLKNTDSIEKIKAKLDSIKEFNQKIKSGEDIVVNKTFETFGDLNSDFDNIFNILDNNIYSALVEWISSFPSFLLDLKLEIGVITSNINSTQKNNSESRSDKISSDELNDIKKNIIESVFEIYRIIILDIIKTKNFWIEFLDLIDADNEVTDFDFDDEIDMNLVMHDLDKEIDLDDSDDEDDFSFGSEDGPFGSKGPGQSTGAIRDAFKAAGEFFKALPGRVSKIRKQFKLFRMRAKNHAFYMKYMGRIDGLYERYSDEAPIMENGMKGDPVQVLKEEGHNYIADVSNGMVDLQHELIDLSKKFASTGDAKQIFNMLKSFGGMYMNDVQKAKQIRSAFDKSIRFKVGELILKNNKIYGYTAQSIAENRKIPPSNHAIVSLFVDRPDEKPYEQKVSDIFKDVESFKLIAKNEKEPIFETTVICSDVLTKGIQKESLNQFKMNKKSSKEKFELTLKEAVSKSKDAKKEKKQLKQQFNYSWKALEAAYNYMLKVKGYILDLIESYFIMMTRIDNLCKECLVSMLQTETMHRDERYQTGHKATNLNAHKEYQQNMADDVETAGEKQYRKIKEKEERQSHRSERREEARERIKRIKKAMRYGDPFKLS